MPVGDAPAFLREDMTLSVEVVTAERAAARVLPLAALRALTSGQAEGRARPPSPRDERAQVLVVHEGRAQLREIRLGLRTIDRIEVAEGLADGERVLLDPTLASGQRVRVRLVDAAQAAAGGPRAAGGDGIGAAMGAATPR